MCMSEALVDPPSAQPSRRPRPSRAVPVQDRGSARLDGLLDACAALLDAGAGTYSFTTAMLARESGSSIGSVYRYFTDRESVIAALAARNTDRFIHRLEGAPAPEQRSLADAVARSNAAFVEMLHDEPGFRVLRFGNDPGVAKTGQANLERVAAVYLSEAERYSDLQVTSEFAVQLRIAMEVAFALLSAAFDRRASGDPVYLAAADQIIRDFLAGPLVQAAHNTYRAS
jgi:AcrR family transcriptional regulator